MFRFKKRNFNVLQYFISLLKKIIKPKLQFNYYNYLNIESFIFSNRETPLNQI